MYINLSVAISKFVQQIFVQHKRTIDIEIVDDMTKLNSVYN